MPKIIQITEEFEAKHLEKQSGNDSENRQKNLYGALAYNQLKVENENGKILFANKMIETASGIIQLHN